jgi:hypothetical protein
MNQWLYLANIILKFRFHSKWGISRLAEGLSVSQKVLRSSKVKIKLSLYRPWRPLGLREVEAPTFSDIQLIGGGKVVSPTRRPLLPPGRLLVLISVRG